MEKGLNRFLLTSHLDNKEDIYSNIKENQIKYIKIKKKVITCGIVLFQVQPN